MNLLLSITHKSNNSEQLAVMVMKELVHLGLGTCVYIYICVLYAHQNPGTYELCYVLKDLLLHVCVQNPEPTLTTFGRLLKAHTLRGMCVTDSEAVCGKLTKIES